MTGQAVCSSEFQNLGSAGPARETKAVQGWPKLWANFRALIEISSQSVGPSFAIWANPGQFSLQTGTRIPNEYFPRFVLVFRARRRWRRAPAAAPHTDSNPARLRPGLGRRRRTAAAGR